MSDDLDLSARIIANYKGAAELYQSDESEDPLSMNGFFNLGLWDHAPRTLASASEDLVEAVVAPLGRAPQPGITRILDVGCGEGGTTASLARRFHEAEIIGINLSAPQLERARHRAPSCRFFEMNATALDFEDESFDAVVCIEAAFHFRPREAFLAEAHRVLRPGGWLLMTDIVFDRPRVSPTIPVENFLADIPAFTGLVGDAGFINVEVEDIRHRTVASFNEFVLSERIARAVANPGPLHARALARSILECTEWHVTIDHYLRVQARRPERTRQDTRDAMDAVT